MGQSPAPRKHAKSPLMRPRRVRFLSPGDPSRLINSDRFDKTGRSLCSLFSGPASLGASFAKKLADRPLLSLFSSRPTSYRGRIFNFCATATSSLSIFGQIRRPLQLRPAKDGTLAEIFCDPIPFASRAQSALGALRHGPKSSSQLLAATITTAEIATLLPFSADKDAFVTLGENSISTDQNSSCSSPTIRTVAMVGRRPLQHRHAGRQSDETGLRQYRCRHSIQIRANPRTSFIPWRSKRQRRPIDSAALLCHRLVPHLPVDAGQPDFLRGSRAIGTQIKSWCCRTAKEKARPRQPGVCFPGCARG
jgi:hypothetical protein